MHAAGRSLLFCYLTIFLVFATEGRGFARVANSRQATPTPKTREAIAIDTRPVT
jgi:hypothetical protein